MANKVRHRVLNRVATIIEVGFCFDLILGVGVCVVCCFLVRIITRESDFDILKPDLLAGTRVFAYSFTTRLGLGVYNATKS